MNLDEQLQILINEGPEHGVSKAVMEKAVIPALKFFASQLQHTHYHVLHSQDRSWLVTTLRHREKQQSDKRVIYAFSTRKDAASFQGITTPDIRIISLPATHILFQLFAVDRLDSIIFMEMAGKKEQGTEIERAKLQNIIDQQLRRLKLKPSSPLTNIPPNFA
jgi:hypothetical protein